MTNNKGQSLVLFVIVMPIILILFGYMIEIAFMGYSKQKIVSVTKSIIANCIDDCQKDDIILLYNDNNIKLEAISISRVKGLSINADVEVDSFIGKIIGKDNYILNINLLGYKDNKKLNFEKGS